MTFIINDLHIGVQRSAGTTPDSAIVLRKYAISALSRMLTDIHGRLIVLGDLFDSYSIPMTDLLEVYQLFTAWLADEDNHLSFIPGNHDMSTDSNKMGSFEFLGKLLAREKNFQYVKGGAWVYEDEKIYAISHVANQDLLDLELAKVPPCDHLLLHANYDNHFAKESDHSLNVSEEQARAVSASQIVFAHEHNHRTELNGLVYVLGNQFPTSISDCLSEQDKFYHEIIMGDPIIRHLSWSRAEGYAELDWRAPVETDAPFIRFVGRASAIESSEAADTIARYRRASSAFVVGNAVKVDTPEGQAALEVESLEAVQSFDVMGATKKLLTKEQVEIIESLA